MWLVDPSRRRDHGRERPHRRARAPCQPPTRSGAATGMTSRGSARAWDAVLVGAGHNALVCAAYLARGGFRTLVLERRERVGGAADTTELAPGIRVPTLAHTVGRLRASIQRDLDLQAHGLALVAPEVRAFAPRS